MKYRKMLPLVHVLLLLLTAGIFISSHGGFKGDSDLTWEDESSSDSAHLGPILFNHWRIYRYKENILVRGFIWINVAPFFISSLIFGFFSGIFEQFSMVRPYGISFATYDVVLGLILAFAQWYGIGILIDVIRQKYNDRGRPTR